uniref:Uncharacterized protein n=1 Tax=Ceratitis capitata TaxID=7213 RepID=W8BYK4_CERCA
MFFAMKRCQIQNVYRPAQKREKKRVEGAALARRCLYVTAIPKLTTTINISCAKKCKRVPVCAVAIFEFFFFILCVPFPLLANNPNHFRPNVPLCSGACFLPLLLLLNLQSDLDISLANG